MNLPDEIPPRPEPCWGGSTRPDWYNDATAAGIQDELAGPVQCPACAAVRPLREYDLRDMPEGRIVCPCGHVLTVNPYEE